MKHLIKKAVAVLLTLTLVSTVFVCFAVDSEKEYYDYGTYVLLGDSVASGHNDLVYLDTEFKRIEGSYSDLVADALGVELIPMACPGFRTIEMRYMMEDDYNIDDGYLFHDAHDAEVMKTRIPEYRKNIAEAGLITLGVGGNDFGTYLTWVFKDTMAEEGYSDEFVAAVNELLENEGIQNDTIDQIIDLAATMGDLPALAQNLPKALAYGLTTFFENWNRVIEDIYALNPDVTLLVIGMFDNAVKTEEDAAANESDELKINIGQMIVDMANTPMKQGAETYGYTFVDTTGTTCDTYHPNANGHKYIANKILEALPDARFPYTDVTPDMSCYNSVVYMYENGVMAGTSDTTFSPNDALTRAQLAQALNNMGVSASVSTKFSSGDEVATGDLALTLLSGASNLGFFGMIKGLSLAVNILFSNGMDFGATVTRGTAAGYLADFCEL